MVVVRHRRRGLLWRVLFRLRVEGANRVPSSGPAIVAGNHVSALDGVVLALTTSSRSRSMTRFLVAAEFFRKLWCGWALRLYRQIPHRRGQRDQVRARCRDRHDPRAARPELSAALLSGPEGAMAADP